MKVLILDDATAKQLSDLWQRSEGKPLRAQPLKLPGAEQLHDLARAGATPEVFTLAMDRIGAADAAASATREQLADLVRSARRVGISSPKLSEWTGYSTRHVLDIANGK